MSYLVLVLKSGESVPSRASTLFFFFPRVVILLAGRATRFPKTRVESGWVTRYSKSHGMGQARSGVLQMSRVGSSRVRRRSSPAGSGGFPASWVGSSRVRVISSIISRVGPGNPDPNRPERSDPTRLKPWNSVLPESDIVYSKNVFGCLFVLVRFINSPLDFSMVGILGPGHLATQTSIIPLYRHSSLHYRPSRSFSCFGRHVYL